MSETACSQHPINFFYHHAGHHLRECMDVAEFDGDTVCSDCGQRQDQWAEPGIGAHFEQYGQDLVHCTGCHSLYVGNAELLGVERMAKGTPVPAKLGMLTGCGALIHPGGATLYLNAFYDKLVQASRPPFNLVRQSGKAVHLSVLNDPPAAPYLYIGDFGRTKDRLIGNMALSDDQWLSICSHNGRIDLPIELTRELIEAMNALPSSQRSRVKAVVMSQLRGEQSPTDTKGLEVLKKAADHSPELIGALRRLPADPHQAFAIMEFI